MAVGIIIGAAFGQIVTSFVQDVLMPPIGRLLVTWISQISFEFDRNALRHGAAAKAAGAATLNYGLFLNTVINFLIVAFAVFLLVRQVNRLLRNPHRLQRRPHATALIACRPCQSRRRSARIAPPSCGLPEEPSNI